MNEKITLPTLVQLLALETGDSKKQSEDFIKEFFSLITESVANNDQVKIKSLGVFKTVTVTARKSVNVSTGEEVEIPAHNKVVFVPSKELAALINEPFEMFETVEVEVSRENPSLNELNSHEAVLPQVELEIEPVTIVTPPVPPVTPPIPPVTPPSPPGIPIKESGEEKSRITKADNENINQDKEIIEIHEAEILSDEKTSIPVEEIRISVDGKDIPEGQPIVTDGDAAEDTEEIRIPKRRFGLGFIVGFLTALIVGFFAFASFFLVDWDNLTFKQGLFTDSGTIDSPVDTVVIAPENKYDVPAQSQTQLETPPGEMSSDEVPTEASDKIVYDEISTTRYLTTMAKDHYGNFNLWPYIYIENERFLGHPNRIKPGTKVVVPPLSKYGVDAQNPDDIEKAKKLGTEIYSRFE